MALRSLRAFPAPLPRGAEGPWGTGDPLPAPDPRPALVAGAEAPECGSGAPGLCLV